METATAGRIDPSPGARGLRDPGPWLAFAAGLAFAAWLLPPAMRDPWQWRWLLEGDAAQHYFGWQFFRHEAWQWPPGRSWAYGEAMGSSIVYADSIPLLALPLKAFSHWLPDPMQYAGPWLAACYALTAAFAWRCGVLAGGRRAAGLLFALFAILAPTIALRAGAHFALAGQWVVLWSLALYLDPRRAPRAAPWLACLGVAALVHAYLLFIVLAVFGAELVRRAGLPGGGVSGMVPRAAGAAVVVAATLYLAGYFVVAEPGAGDRQYGVFGADLDAWFTSLDGARLAAYHAPSASRGLEGMHYLGAGALLALVVGLIAGRRTLATGLRAHWPLAAAAALLAALAVTHRIGWGGATVATLPLSDDALSLLSVFRGSGRLLWLADWLLLLLAVALPFRALAPRRALALGVACLVVQAIDLAPPLAAKRGRLAHEVLRVAQAEVPDARFWAEAASRYGRLSVVPMEHAPKGWEGLALVAERAGWSIDSGQFARAPWAAWRAAREWQLAALRAGLLEPGTVYVLADPRLVNADALPDDVAAGAVDGWWVLAPGWSGCCLGPARDVAAFARHGPVPAAIAVEGAELHASVGLWDDGWAEARAGFAMRPLRDGVLRLRLRVPGPLRGSPAPRVRVDGEPVAAASIGDGALEVVVAAIAGRSLHVRIDAPAAWTPGGAGGGDRRALSWFLESAAVAP